MHFWLCCLWLLAMSNAMFYVVLPVISETYPCWLVSDSGVCIGRSFRWIWHSSALWDDSIFCYDVLMTLMIFYRLVLGSFVSGLCGRAMTDWPSVSLVNHIKPYIRLCFHRSCPYWNAAACRTQRWFQCHACNHDTWRLLSFVTELLAV